MTNETTLRNLIQEILNEAIETVLLGKMDEKPAIVIGKNARKYLEKMGMMKDEIDLVYSRINNITVEQFQKYDQDFRNAADKFGLKPSLLKAMAIEETSLGKNLSNLQGSTAAGIIQITKPTLTTLNKNLPAGTRYDYNSLLSDPSKSIEIAAHYIKDFLIGKRNLKDRESILRAYKTGPDAENYVKRVNAFKKFVDIIGLI